MKSKKVSSLQPGMKAVPCPLCSSQDYVLWASENGFRCVRCTSCGLLFVNPCPSGQIIDKAVQLGSHDIQGKILDVKSHRVAGNVRIYGKLVKRMFRDMIVRNQPVSWLDVGAGYGEFVEAVARIAPPGSTIEGLEPMKHKANDAKARGLSFRVGYLKDVDRRYDYVSLMDVFSHIPDFLAFLQEIISVLRDDGELLIKTGNAADIGERNNFPGPLTLPDHLVFAGERQLVRFLSESGFEIIFIRRGRMDGVLYTLKNVVKWFLGRPVHLAMPYTSPSRNLFVRSRLVARKIVLDPGARTLPRLPSNHERPTRPLESPFL